MKTTLLIITSIVTTAIAAPAQNLTSLLQKGLAEEEINRDPAAAIEQYGILLAEFNKGRQHAATALFRIAECHRKLGDDKAAVMSLRKLIALYPKQEKLAALARQNLTTLGAAPALEWSAPGVVELSEEEAKAMTMYRSVLRDRPDTIKNGDHLRIAIRDNQVTAVRFLLEQGSNPNPNPQIGVSPNIDSATGLGNLSIVKLLLSYGAKVTPSSLSLSIKYGYSALESVLLDAIQSNGGNFDYFPALSVAIEKHLDETFSRLIAHGADPKALSEDGVSLLHRAAEYRRTELCRKLTNTYKLPVDQRDNLGLTALHHAAHKRSPEIVKHLLSLGANPKSLAQNHLGRFRTSETESSILMQILNSMYQLEHEDIVNIVEQLIAAGADVNYQDNYGNTVLHYAVMYAENPGRQNTRSRQVKSMDAKDRAAVVVALLKAGADKRIKNKKGKYPVDLDRSHEFGEVLKNDE